MSNQGFNPSLYPRTYVASAGNRVAWISLGSLLALAGLFGSWYFGTGHDVQNSRAALLMSLSCLLFVAFGSYLSLSMLMSKVILRVDAIEVQSIGSKQKLLRDEIVGRRLLPTQYISTLELVPREKKKKKLKIAMTMCRDAAFDAWFASIPDLNAAEFSKSEAEIASDLEFGLTPEQRSECLAEGRTTAKWLTRITWVTIIWGVFYPRPYKLIVAILAAEPLIAVMLVARSKGLYQLEGRRNDARPSLAIPFIFPGLILVLHAIYAANFLRWIPFFSLSLAGGCVLTVLIASADRQIRGRPPGIVGIFLLAAVYTFGITAQVDELLDRSPRQIFEVSVLSKRVSRGSKSTTYYLHVAPWGPQRDANDVSVSGRLYDSVRQNQIVCINLFEGGLKIPWYFITACR